MATNRLEVLRSMVEQNPSDSFSRYGLAMEYVRSGDLLTAMDEFLKLLDHNPNYAAALLSWSPDARETGPDRRG